MHAWRSPAIAEAAVADGIDVVTSHGYYLTAGDGPDTDYVITWVSRATVLLSDISSKSVARMMMAMVHAFVLLYCRR